MADEEGKRLREAAAWADMSGEERVAKMKVDNKKNPPWAAGMNPLKRGDDDWGISPEEFRERTKGGFPKEDNFRFFTKVGKGYSVGGMKVKVPKLDGKEGEFELVDMNKYNDPYNSATLTGRYYGNPPDEFGNSVGYGADVRGNMLRLGLLREHTEQQMRGAYQHKSRKAGRRAFDEDTGRWVKKLEEE